MNRPRAIVPALAALLACGAPAHAVARPAPSIAPAPADAQTAPAAPRPASPDAPRDAERRGTERRPPQRAVRQAEESGGLKAVRTIDAAAWQPGAPISMTVSASAPEGASVRMPALDGTFGAFDVRPDGRTARDAGADVLQVTLVAWDAGPVEVPAMEVAATLADGTEARITLPAVTVELASLVGDDMPLTELASDIRGPVDIATGRWAWWAAAGAAAVAALAFTWWLRSRGAAPPPEPPLAPAEWARRELDRLDADALPRRGDVDGFFVRLSSIVRTYIEGRFAIAAPDRTTQEFLREASTHPDLAGDRSRELGAFLRTADMVKFAAARPPEETCAEAMRAMRGFVESTAPGTDGGTTDAGPRPGGGAPRDRGSTEAAR